MRMSGCHMFELFAVFDVIPGTKHAAKMVFRNSKEPS